MSYFNITNETQVFVDASRIGLLAILAQRKPGTSTIYSIIAYASRALNDFSDVYKAGIGNPADYLSRHPVKIASKQQSDKAEENINFLTNAIVPDTLTLDEIKEATQQDRTLRALRAALKTGYWNIDDLKP